jgi:hypothetical protein
MTVDLAIAYSAYVSQCHLQIKVLLPNKQYKEGTLQHYNLHYNVALVGVKDFHPLRPARILDDQWNPKILEDPNVVAVGRCFKSGVLMATPGRRTDWSGTLDYRDLRYSSCKITKVSTTFWNILSWCIHQMMW